MAWITISVPPKFSTDIFTENMLRGKLGINAIESTKSLYDLVVLDSMGTEKTLPNPWSTKMT